MRCARRTWSGSSRVLDAVAKAGVPRLVYASSVGAYSPGSEGPRRRRELANGWHRDVVLLPPQGRGRIASSTSSSAVSRASASCAFDLASSSSARPRPRSVALPGAVRAAHRLLSPCPGRDSRHRATSVSGRSLRRRGRGVSPCGHPRGGAGRLQRRDRARPRSRTPWPKHSAPERSRFPRASCAGWRPRRGAPGFSRRPEGWLDMALGVPIMELDEDPQRAGLGAAPRRSTETLSSSSTAFATPPARARLRSTRVERAA